MKRIGGFLCCLLIVVSMSACAQNNSETMYIETAQLTEDEKNIAELLGLNTEYCIYNFYLDDTVNSMQINTYELIDGAWYTVAGGGGQSFTDKEGRIALGFKNIADGMRVAIQSEHNYGATSYDKENDNDTVGMALTTSKLADKKEIVYEQEIPLVIQINTSKNNIHAYAVDYFFEPAEYAKYGYEHVYAITVLFSQKTVGELST